MSDENNIIDNTESEKETLPQKKDSYSIYEYLKENTSFLIALVSALVAIVTLILKFGSYLYHIAYLNYWNIDPKLVSSSDTYWVEDIALSLVLLITGIVYMSLVNETASAFQKHRYIVKYSKKLLKDQKREIKSLIKEKKKHLNQKKNKKRMNDISDKIRNLVLEYEEDKKEVRKTKIYSWLGLLIHTIIFDLFFGIILYICILKYNYSSGNSLIAMIASLLFLSLIPFILSYFNTNFDKKALKEKCLSILHENNNLIDDNNELPMFPINRIKHLGIKYFLSNNHIFRLLFYVVLISVFFFLVVHDQGKKDANDFKKSYSITRINNLDYVIITTDADNIIAERIDINGKTAIVYVNEQKIIPKENIEMKINYFDNISKVYN